MDLAPNRQHIARQARHLAGGLSGAEAAGQRRQVELQRSNGTELDLASLIAVIVQLLALSICIV